MGEKKTRREESLRPGTIRILSTKVTNLVDNEYSTNVCKITK